MVMLRSFVRAAPVIAAVLLACSSGGNGGASAQSDVGKACSTNAECASGICIPKIGETITDATKGICSVQCTAGGSECVRGWSCLASNGQDLCQCAPRGAETCDNGIDDDCNGLVDDAPICQCTQTKCGNACVDTNTDKQNCGACGAACPDDATCANASCVCPNDRTACKTGCVDDQTDPMNCGGCGVVCGPGSACAGGECHCGSDGAGESCAVGETSTGRSFCSADARCMTATNLVFPSMCGGEVTASGEYGGVLIDCRTLSSDLYFLPKGGAMIACGGGMSPNAVTDGTMAFAYSYGGIQGLYTCPSVAASFGAPPFSVSSPKVRAVGGGYFFWLAGKVERCSTAGCVAPEELTTTPALTSALLEADASGLYALIDAGTLLRFALDGGTGTELGTIADATAMTFDGDRILITTTTGIVSCPKTGCLSGATPYVVQAEIRGAKTDATHVWWASKGLLHKCPKSGACSQPTVVVGGVPDFGMDDDFLYIGKEKIAK